MTEQFNQMKNSLVKQNKEIQSQADTLVNQQIKIAKLE